MFAHLASVVIIVLSRVSLSSYCVSLDLKFYFIGVNYPGVRYIFGINCLADCFGILRVSSCRFYMFASYVCENCCI